MIFMEMDLITRRQFIKKTGLATGALLFSGSLMSGKKYKKEKDIAGKSKKRDSCDAGPAAVFGDFADELGDRKGTPGAERYFCFRARFRSAKNAAVLSSVIPQALSPH